MRIFLEYVTSDLQDMMLNKTDDAGRTAASVTRAVIDERKEMLDGGLTTRLQ